MQTFVSQISNYIFSQNHPLHQWVIVVPSERSVKFIQKALYEKAGKPILSPNIITISRFFETVVPFKIMDKTRLLFQLYQIHAKHTSSDEKSFDEFYNWGKIVLSDFEEIDRYLIDANQLFKNLKDIKEIENWSFNSEELTETQKKFIQFWLDLGIYHGAFKTKLQQQNAIFSGWAVRQISENIDWIFKKYPNNRFLFAGFNAHSPAELSVIKQLINLGKGDILVDADNYYMKNSLHEAGSFIRSNLDTLGIPLKLVPIKEQLENKELEVNVIACSQMTGQVKAAATILNSMDKEAIDETLVLLAEEDLLVPLLKNIPGKVKEANITLGLSLDNSILKTWIELIFRIQKGLQTKKSAYHKDIFEICYHPFVEEILNKEEKAALIELETVFKKNNLIYASVDKLSAPEKIKTILSLIYTNWQHNWADAIQQIRKTHHFIYQYLDDKTNEYELALLETFDKGIIDLQNCLLEDAPEMNLVTFKNLFTRHYASLTISYYGNPVEGLQIMGLLETRALDFKRIICIGMNEKNMPPSNQIESLIPMDLRNYLGMPTVRAKQGIFAHHFYRLLHEVEELHITYSTNTQDFNSSEKSRYLVQMELELARVNPKITFNYQDYSINSDDSVIADRIVERNDYTHQLIKEYLLRGISASGLGTYNTCPLNFFYKYILRFNDELKVEEDIESSSFGSMIHEALEDMYRPFTNRTLTEKRETLVPFSSVQIGEFKKHIDYELNKRFKEHFNSEEAFSFGKNRLTFEMAKKLSHGFLNYEEKRLLALTDKIYIEEVEQELTTEIEGIYLWKEDEKITLKLKGIIDRIDYYNGGYHIVDYKSGKVDYSKFKLKEISEESVYAACLKESKFIQLYFYLYLFYRNFKTYPKSITFVSFVNINKVESVVDEGMNFEELVALFPRIIQRFISDIYDESKPIQHKAANPMFSYCDFC